MICDLLRSNPFKRVSSLTLVDSPGPVTFKMALDQAMFVNATMVHTLSDQLGSLTLKSIPGESAPTLSEQVTKLAREIKRLGKPPLDLKNLISKPHTKGTVDEFKQHALTVHALAMRGMHTLTWQEMVAENSAVHQDLVQLGDCPLAKGGKQDQDESIQGLMAKTVDQHLQQWENKNSNGGNSAKNGNGKSNKKRACFNCGSFDHLVKDCPKDKQEEGKSDNGYGKTNWRHQPPNSLKGREERKDGQWKEPTSGAESVATTKGFGLRENPCTPQANTAQRRRVTVKKKRMMRPVTWGALMNLSILDTLLLWKNTQKGFMGTIELHGSQHVLASCKSISRFVRAVLLIVCAAHVQDKEFNQGAAPTSPNSLQSDRFQVCIK